METFIVGYIVHIISAIPAHPFPLCFIENHSLYIHASCLCMSFSIYEVRSNEKRHRCTLFCRLLFTNFPLQHFQITDNAQQFDHCRILPLKCRNWKLCDKCGPQVRTTAFKHQWKSISSLKKGQKYHKHKVHSTEIYIRC